MFKQEIARFGLSVESGTDAVPNDGKYYVIREGDVVLETPSQKKAVDAYNKLRRELLDTMGNAEEAPDPREVLARERMESEVYAVRADAFRRREAGARAKGGKGGRGGVSK